MIKQNIEQDTLLTLAYYNYQKGLAKHSFFKLHNQTISDDLVQDTFIKAWSYMMRGGKIETMKAFLYHVLNDLIIDEYRKQKTVSLDTLVENGFEPTHSDSDSTLNTLDGKIALHLVKNLPHKYREVLRMRYGQDLSLQEMSARTGQTKNTLAVQIHRGLEKLRTLYQPA